MDEASDFIVKPKPFHHTDSLSLPPKPSTLKYLTKEYERICQNPNDGYTLKPDEANILVWYFLIHGSQETPFHLGCYLGMLILPCDFPFNPPEIQMISPSGRFRRRNALCLSNSSFHNSSWIPSWNLDNLMLGFVSYMNGTDHGTGCIYPQLLHSTISQMAVKSKRWLFDKCKIFKIVFENEYSILQEVYDANLDDKYFMNQPLVGPNRYERVKKRLEAYRTYLLEITMSLSTYSDGQKDSLLRKYFSIYTDETQVNNMELLPIVYENTVPTGELEENADSGVEDEIEIATDDDEDEIEIATDDDGDDDG